MKAIYCVFSNLTVLDSELNVDAIKNVYGFFVYKEEFKLNHKTKVKYACRLCNSEDKSITIDKGVNTTPPTPTVGVGGVVWWVISNMNSFKVNKIIGIKISVRPGPAIFEVPKSPGDIWL